MTLMSGASIGRLSISEMPELWGVGQVASEKVV
jgi:hypothetical protein